MNAAPAAMAQSQPVSQLVNTAWLSYEPRIATGFSQVVEIPLALAASIGPQGINAIVKHYNGFLKAPVSAFEDNVRGILQIGPSHLLAGHEIVIPGVEKPQVKTAKESKIARPPNAFILYRMEQHPIIKAENPEFHNNQISVELGLKWKNEDARVKAYYIELAKKVKARHLLQHPNYQYRPRKPNEKKRRVTRRKNPASANAIHSESTSSDKPAANSVEASSRDVVLPVPEVPKNSAGNAMLELGDQDLDEETFQKMVDGYNKSSSTQPSHVNIVIAEATTTPIIYGELSEDAQNDSNFYQALQDNNPFELNGIAGLDDLFGAPLGYEDLLAAEAEDARQTKAIFDMAHGESTENILARMSSVFEED